MVRAYWCGDHAGDDQLLRLPDSRSKDSVLRFFMSDQTVCERKTDGDLRWLSGNEVVREGGAIMRSMIYNAPTDMPPNECEGAIPMKKVGALIGNNHDARGRLENAGSV